MLAILVFHFRSLVIVTPRYLTESTEATGEELMVTCTCGLERHLEMTRRELFVGLITLPVMSRGQECLLGRTPRSKAKLLSRG